MMRLWLVLVMALAVGSGLAAAHGSTRGPAGAPVRAPGLQQESYSLELVGRIGGPAYGLAVQGGYAYLASRDGLRVVSLTDPANPTEVARLSSLLWAGDVAVSGRYAYVVTLYALHVIDISDPLAPIEVGRASLPVSAGKPAVQGTYAYVPDHRAGLLIFDISNPAAPVAAGSVARTGPTTSWFAEGVAVRGTYAYATGAEFWWRDGFPASTARLRIIDVSNPAQPRGAAFYDTASNMLAVALDGPRAYLAGNGGLAIVAVSDPLNPVALGSLQTLPLSDVAVSGRYAYVVSQAYRYAYVVDVANPAAPRPVAAYDFPSDAMRVALSGPLVYVSTLSDGLFILRFSALGRQAFLPQVLHGAVGP